MTTSFVQTKTAEIRGQTTPKKVNISLVSTSGRYRIGPSERPPIKHDNGFLDKFNTEPPTFADRAQLAWWITQLEGAEAFRPDLADATAAYRHFLTGSGADRSINYERYIESDKSGEVTLKRILADFVRHTTIIGKNRDHFFVTSSQYALGGGSEFPYPQTENWQKAIGAHFAWVSGEVHIATNSSNYLDEFSAIVEIHIEDMYNFNPGAADIATGIPDSANGRFEVTGLAKQYRNLAKITRNIGWTEGQTPEAAVDSASGNPRLRQRRPNDNRRLRNRV